MSVFYCMGCDTHREKEESLDGGSNAHGQTEWCAVCLYERVENDLDAFSKELREKENELDALRKAVERVDAALELILSANSDSSFDQYLDGDAAKRWAAILEAADPWDFPVEASK